ncbi:E3 ubiquitin-protein ligase PDZRN3-like isoform X2 [Amphiura filiformis]|uniref:E3 ubiquitin-protein ligase PDZRN3-like isoform X2 n=1 Tax=Amphiura filiformis TaxID=82378 RepID=UPI003B20DB72
MPVVPPSGRLEHGGVFWIEAAAFRMDFIILNVNGIDLSKATHEEAVEAFKNAAEPIAVEVLRRAPCTTKVNVGDKCRTVCTCNVGTQTDLQSEDFLWKMLQNCPSPLSPMSPMTPTGKSDVDFDGLCEEPLIDSELMNDLEGMENMDMPIIDEDGLDKAYEMEYEEIVLCRNSGSDKLGLTLCYGQEDDIGIFISEVDPNFIAGEDGRIKEGDQILQINGEDVHNKDQALELFAQQVETTMLVCRPQLRLEDCLYDERNALLDDLQLDMLEQTHQEAMQFTSLLEQDDDDDDDDDECDDQDGQTDTTGTTTTGSTNPHEKDSGVGRATDGASNTTDDDAGSNQKFPMDSASLGSGEMRYSNDSFTSNEAQETEYNGQISLEDCMKFQAALESKCDKHMRSDTDESMRGKDSKVMRLGSDSMETTSASGDSLNRNCRNRLGSDPEEDQSLEQLNGQSSSQLSSPVTNGNMADVFGESKDIDTEKDTRNMDSSSAKSSPKHRPGELVIGDTEDSADESPAPLTVQKTPKRQPSDSTVRQHRAPRTVPGSPSRSKSSSSSSRDRSKSDRSSSSDSRKAKGSPAKSQSQQQQTPHQLLQQQLQQQLPLDRNVPLLPYPRRPATNPHLRGQQFNRNPYLMQQEHQAQLIRNNWKLQQQHQSLRQNMQKYGSMQSILSIPAHAKHYRSYMHLVTQNEENALTAADSGTDRSARSAEWKVKIRSDGTRYITKKSTARDRVLKERANRIREERTGGLTTDDEAVSEMKLGKYWSKDDRKRHLERARDQKRRREYMVQARMECLQEQDELEGKKAVNIVELSHRKLLKKKGRKMLMDDFTTVQEMLVHGTRISPETAKEFNPWLNVTTV